MRGPSASMRGVLLGLVLERPGHGGDLANRLKTRLGVTWRIDSNDVYRLLEQLENDRLVQSRMGERRSGQRLAHLVFYPTDRAPKALAQWIETLMPREPVRLGLQAKVAVAREQDIPALLIALSEYERQCRLMGRVITPLDGQVGSWTALCRDCMRDVIHRQLEAEAEWAARTRQRINNHVRNRPERTRNNGHTSAGAGGRGPWRDLWRVE